MKTEEPKHNSFLPYFHSLLFFLSLPLMCFMIYLVDWVLSLSLVKAVAILSLCTVTGNALAPSGADSCDYTALPLARGVFLWP